MATAALLMMALTSAGAVGWRNIDAAHHLGGRKATAGYLQGKVVLVCRWNATNATSRALLPRIEQLWASFKTKQFVVLGGPVVDGCSAEEVRKFVAARRLTFPIYEEAGAVSGVPRFEGEPFLYVVDETGKLVYFGSDDRNATQAFVSALTDQDAPKGVNQWVHYLDYELENLPGHAYLRLREFNRQHPDAAKAYLEKGKALVAMANIKPLADLIEFAKRAKDVPDFSKNANKQRTYETLVKTVLQDCAPLKNLPDPRMAQEAKNALADLKWVQATF